MKNATKHFALFALLTLFAINATAQATSKTFSKAFNLNGATTVNVDVPGTVEIKPWDNASLRFVITVTLPNGSTNVSVIDQLAGVGRYDLEMNTTTGIPMVEAKNLKRTIKVKGQDFKETVTFVVLVPKGVTVENLSAKDVAEVKK